MSPTNGSERRQKLVNGDSYIFPRDKGEFARLSAQHIYLTKAVCDGRLVCDKSIHLPVGGAVLDAGCGTGAWLCDLAAKSPGTMQFYGSDISSDNFPENAPSNVYLTVASTTSLPQTWSGKFALVNQRLLVGGLRASDWPVALSELYRVLEPGGAIQLVEMDIMETRKHLHGPAMKRVAELSNTAWERAELMTDVARRLPSLLVATGFVDIKSLKKTSPVGERKWGSLGKMGSTIYRPAYENLGWKLRTMGLITSITEYEGLVDRLVKEWEDLGPLYIFQVVTARKPARAPTLR